MTATFLGFCSGHSSQVLGDLVATARHNRDRYMMPIIALELLGALYQVRTRKAAKTKSLEGEQLR